MENMATWTKNVCLEISLRNLPNHVDSTNCLPAGQPEKDLSSWSVLDVGTGNGLLLQELSKLGYSTHLNNLLVKFLLISVPKSFSDNLDTEIFCLVCTFRCWDTAFNLYGCHIIHLPCYSLHCMRPF